VYLAGACVPAADAVLAVALYIAMGAIGLPVFSGFSGGAQKLIGVTGGYIWGYILLALITSLVVKRYGAKRTAYPLGMALGTAACYFVGTAWFMFVTKSTLAAAFMACILPFLPGDAVKIAAVTVIAPRVRPLIYKNN
jgi:biotin transport system substrate-specific component